MGLFENKKKVCPICHRPTPRILPAIIEDMPICKECAGKIDLPDGMAAQMSLEDFRQYLTFYEKNKVLRDIFFETYRLEFGIFGSEIILDTANRLFRLKDVNTSLVMEASNLISFCILEDNVPLFEGEGNILKCHSSRVPALVKSLAPQIAQFCMQQEIYEQLERMGREKESFDAPLPFKRFYVELALSHPYWDGFRGKLGAPDFDRYHPSVDIYMRDYQEKVDQLHTLAVNLMQLINPDALEVYDVDNIPAAEAAVNEIQKYKSLLEAGIITEEEFAAKKRQLLGI